MKVTFYSTFLTMHQVPFCDAMYRLLGDDFRYVACEATYEERLRFGYEDLNSAYPYVLRRYESEEADQEAFQLSLDSDVVIIGSAPEKFCRTRLLRKNKLTFRYAERPLKPSANPHSVKFLINMLYRHISYRHKNCYLLAAGAYSAPDFAKYGCYKGKAFKWGYFTELVGRTNMEHTIPEILWAARMISLKHPEFCVRLAERLEQEGIDFHMTIGGNGDLLQKMQKEFEHNDHVDVVGKVPQNQMSELYQNSDLYLMTSDYEEGWGAVITESMSAGCAVVASSAAGSVPWLIQNGVNGYTFESEDFESFYRNVRILLVNPALRERIRKSAEQTIRDLWNAEVAAERFLYVAQQLLSGEEFYYEDGPMSRA